jgi:hypothetical protein
MIKSRLVKGMLVVTLFMTAFLIYGFYPRGVKSRWTDWKCFYDCIDAGYSMAFCKRVCEY